MWTSRLQKCNISNPGAAELQVPADPKLLSTSDALVATNADASSHISSRKRIEVAILMVTLVLLVFQGMTFAFVKRVDDNLQTIIQTDGFTTTSESKTNEAVQPKFPGHRQSLSISH